jgi:hypothetical protein
MVLSKPRSIQPKTANRALINPRAIDLSLRECLPSFTAAPSMALAPPTRLADSHTLEAKRIDLPERHYPEVTVTITVKTGDTGGRPCHTITARAYQGLRRSLRQVTPLDLAGQFIFDGRRDPGQTLAHSLDHVAFPVLFAQRALSKKLGRGIKIHVVLPERPGYLVRQAYETLGIAMVFTDDNVHGNIVTLSTDEIYSAIPDLANIQLYESNQPTPKQIFITHRGNRSVTNHGEISNFLEQRGFVTCYLEDYNPRQQWMMVRHARTMVTMQGEASAHLAFNQVGLDGVGPGPRILEICSPSADLQGRRYLAPLLHGKWCAVRGQITPEAIRAIDFSDGERSLSPLVKPTQPPFRVDVGTVAMGLDYLQLT